jgi:hypothetical protein
LEELFRENITLKQVPFNTFCQKILPKIFRPKLIHKIDSRSSKPDLLHVAKPETALMQPSSPTKSFLTQFPVVKEKPAKADKSVAIGQPKDPAKVPAAKPVDLSVFDFSESRDRFYEYPFWLQTSRLNFHPQIWDRFTPKTRVIK